MNHIGFEWNSCKILRGMCAVFFWCTIGPLGNAAGERAALRVLNAFSNKVMQENKAGVASCCVITDPGWSSLLGFKSSRLSKEEKGLERWELLLLCRNWSTVNWWQNVKIKSQQELALSLVENWMECYLTLLKDSLALRRAVPELN